MTTAVCGSNVTNMAYAYRNCSNLTTAVCGLNVTNMSHTYSNCPKLTIAICGPNVTYMNNTYQSCRNVQGNMYVYSNVVNHWKGCFSGRNTSNRLNIYMHNNSTSLNEAINSASKITGANTTTWTQVENYYYNTTYNIYIYPVSNVEASRIANRD